MRNRLINEAKDELTALRSDKIMAIAMMLGGLMAPPQSKNKSVDKMLARLAEHLQSDRIDVDWLYHNLADLLDSPDYECLDKACERILDAFGDFVVGACTA